MCVWWGEFDFWPPFIPAIDVENGISFSLTQESDCVVVDSASGTFFIGICILLTVHLPKKYRITMCVCVNQCVCKCGCIYTMLFRCVYTCMCNVYFVCVWSYVFVTTVIETTGCSRHTWDTSPVIEADTRKQAQNTDLAPHLLHKNV